MGGEGVGGWVGNGGLLLQYWVGREGVPDMTG